MTWNALRKIARDGGITVDRLWTEIADVTASDASFADAVRCYVVGYRCDKIPDDLLPDEIRSFRHSKIH